MACGSHNKEPQMKKTFPCHNVFMFRWHYIYNKLVDLLTDDFSEGKNNEIKLRKILQMKLTNSSVIKTKFSP